MPLVVGHLWVSTTFRFVPLPLVCMEAQAVTVYWKPSKENWVSKGDWSTGKRAVDVLMYLNMVLCCVWLFNILHVYWYGAYIS